jgi:hypothetical protein
MRPGRPAATRPPGAVRDVLVTGRRPATNRRPGMAGTRRWPIRSVAMPGQHLTRSRPAGRVRPLVARLAAAVLPVIFLLNGRCGVLAPANQLTSGSLPGRGRAAAARTAVLPGRPIARRAGLVAVTSRAHLPAGDDGASPAASIAGPPRPSLRRRQTVTRGRAGGACPGVRRTGTLAGPGAPLVSAGSQAAWSHRATRREAVTCPRRPARPSCGQRHPVGGRNHLAGRCPGGGPVATAALATVRREARRASSTPGRGRSSHRVGGAGGGTGKKQSPARPQRAVSGQRQTGSRWRLLLARIMAGHNPNPRTGVGRRLTAGAAAGRRAASTGTGRRPSAGVAAGPGRPRTPVGQKPIGGAALVRGRPRTSGGRRLTGGAAAVPGRPRTGASQ